MNVSVADFRARTVRLIDLLESARKALEEAEAEAGFLLDLIEGRGDIRWEGFPRLEAQVRTCVKDLANNLGADVHDDRPVWPDFEIERMPQDARDLLDLVDLASTGEDGARESKGIGDA